MPDLVTYFGYIPNEIWSGLFGALIAGVMASLATDKANKHNLASLELQHAHEERLSRQRIAKERLEELYIQVDRWGNALLLSCAGMSYLIKNEFSLRQYKDHISPGNMPKADFGRLEMLVGIHGGSLREVFDNTTRLQQELALIDARVIDSKMEGRLSGVHLNAYEKLVGQYEIAVYNFKSEIIKLANQI